MATCELCGSEAVVRVRFRQNAGVLIRRVVRRVDGELCGHCAHETYVRMKTVNLTLGWAGVISMFVAPYYLLANWRQFRRIRHVVPRFDATQRRRLRKEAALDALVDMLGVFVGNTRARKVTKAIEARSQGPKQYM
jgi:hypothetical protein